ncbi:MAG: ABC transporter permease, partial [Vicinamibacterales bacterium]
VEVTGRIREWALRLAETTGLRGPARDFEDEVETHIALAADDLEQRGVPADEARRAAARFGSRAAAAQRVREQRGLPRLDALLTDVRDVVRGLRRAPGFTSAALIVLAIGIGTNVAVFTVANAALFKGFAGIEDNGALVYLTTGRDCCISYQDLLDWRRDVRTLDGIGAVADLRVAVDAGAGAETATATEITANTLAVVGARPRIGRDFVPADDVPGATPVAIVSDTFWRRRLDADPRVLGRVLRVNGRPTAIVGVMPAGFAFPQYQDVWLPLGPRATGQPRDARGLWFGVGRLAPGASVNSVRAELEAIGDRLAVAFPSTNTGVRPWVQTFRAMFMGPDALLVYGSLWVAVGILLTMACANLANLLLARSVGRTREAGLRLVLGAGHWRVVRSQVIEGVLLAGGGMLLGTVVRSWLLQAYASVAVPPTQPWAAQLLDDSTDGRVLLYAAATTVATGLAMSLVPAWRVRTIDMMSAVRAGGRGTIGSGARPRAAAWMVATQVALAVVRLAASGVLTRSFLNVRDRDLGYDPGRLLTTLTVLPASRYPSSAAQFDFYDRTEATLLALPGVERVAFSDAGVAQRGGQAAFEVEGTPDRAQARPRVRTLAVSPGYFDTMGTALRRGRDFDVRDGSPDRLGAVVNHRMALLYWNDEDVVGRRLNMRGTPPGRGGCRDCAGPAPWRSRAIGCRAGALRATASASRTRSLGGAHLFPPASLIEEVRRRVRHWIPRCRSGQALHIERLDRGQLLAPRRHERDLRGVRGWRARAGRLQALRRHGSRGGAADVGAGACGSRSVRHRARWRASSCEGQ